MRRGEMGRLAGAADQLIAAEPVLLFDGHCGLCGASARWIRRTDRYRTIRLIALQSAAGQSLLAAHDLPRGAYDSIVFIERGRWFTKSTAVLRTCRHLPGLWKLFYGLLLVPRPIRDWIYDVVARNRFRWFDRTEACPVGGQ